MATEDYQRDNCLFCYSFSAKEVVLENINTKAINTKQDYICEEYLYIVLN